MDNITIPVDVYEQLIEDQKRAEYLQKEADEIDELHFDDCAKLHTKIAELERKLLYKGVN